MQGVAGQVSIPVATVYDFFPAANITLVATSFVCPPNSIISTIRLRAGLWVDHIKEIACTNLGDINGPRAPIAVNLGDPAGGEADNVFSASGFNKMQVGQYRAEYNATSDLIFYKASNGAAIGPFGTGADLLFRHDICCMPA